MVIEVVLGVLLGVVQHGLADPLPRPCGRDFIKEHNDAVDRTPMEDRAAPIILQAEAALKLPEDFDERSALLKPPPAPSDGEHAKKWAAMRSMLAENGEALRLARQAAKCKSTGAYRTPDDVTVRPDEDRYFISVDCLLPHLGAYRTLCRLLTCEAADRIDRGDAEGAVESITTALALARTLADEPVMISQMVVMALHAWIIEQGVLRLINEPTLAISNEQYSRLEAALKSAVSTNRAASIDDREFIQDIIGRMYCRNGEWTTTPTAEGKRLFAAVFIVSQDPHSHQHKYEQLRTGKEIEGLEVALAVLSRLADRDAMLAKLEEHHAAARALFANPLATADDSALSAFEEDISSRSRRFTPIATMLPAAKKLYVSSESFYQLLAAARLAVAISHHRQVHGKWPSSLDDLKRPDLIEDCVDRYTGQSLLYHLGESGPVIYSTGPDRDDDEGRSGELEPTHWQPVGKWIGVPPSDAPDGDWLLWSASIP